VGVEASTTTTTLLRRNAVSPGNDVCWTIVHHCFWNTDPPTRHGGDKTPFRSMAALGPSAVSFVSSLLITAFDWPSRQSRF
jgi:hypothetical protein